MKKILSLLLVLTLSIISAASVGAHSGRTDSSGGHNCSAKSISKGLCTGYHYHNGGSSSSGSSSSYTPSYSSYPTYEVIQEPVLVTADVYINNVLQSYNPSAYVKNGTTLVPMRAIFESLDATVDYNTSMKKITAYKGTKKIVLGVGNTVAYVNDNGSNNSISLSHPAEVYKKTTMVPLRFVSEALGTNVEWDGYSVYITR